MQEQTYKLLQAIGGVLAIIAYALIIGHYLPKSGFWKRTIKALHALKPRWESNRILAISYSIRYEIAPIILISLLLNIIGWGLTSNENRDILYLDMTGTAMTAFLLGPWWGAVTGILTAAINTIFYPADADVVLKPWMLVNIAGGIFWGLIARSNKFRLYVKGASSASILTQIKSHLWYLLLFGVLGASVMAVAGSIVSAVADPHGGLGFANNSGFGAAVQSYFENLKTSIQNTTSAGESKLGASVLTELLRWAVFTIRYIPDKTISVAVGLLAVKYIFPLFEQNLICMDLSINRRGDSWLTPVICIVCYLLPFSPVYSDSQSIFWYLPIIIFLIACVCEFLFGPDSNLLLASRGRRLALYSEAISHLPREEFFGATVITVLVSLLLFISGLFVIGSIENRGTFALFFLRTVLIYLAAFYLLRLSRRQWAATLYLGQPASAKNDTNADSASDSVNKPS
ncbi:MAG: hypothetical protein WA584_02105 [Pyrinomonadaceae bacterium]